MEQDAPDSVNLMHNEKRKSSTSTLPAKRRRLVMESDSEAESDEDCIILGSSLPGMQRWTSEDRQYEGEHEFEDIAEVYGSELSDGLGEINTDAVDDDDDLGDSDFCAICDDGGQLLCCDGPCMRSFHASKETARQSVSKCRSLRLEAEEYQEVDSWYCLNCKHGQQQCFICGVLGKSEGERKQVFVCDVALCGRFYHVACLGKWKEQEGTIKDWSDFTRSVKEEKGFFCPAHHCRRCGKGEEESSDNKMKLAKCRRCPKAYHKMCLPKTISFDSRGDKHVRAWEIGTRFLMYCLRHDIIEEFATPARDHIKWSVVPSLKQKDLQNFGGPLTPNYQKMTQAASLKQKHESMRQASSVNQGFLNVTKQYQRVHGQHKSSSKHNVDVTQRFRVDHREKGVPDKPKDKPKDSAMCDTASPAVQGPVVVRPFGLPKILEPSKRIEELRRPVKKIYVSREGQQSRVARLMQQAALRVTMDDVKKMLVKPSCYQENREKNYGHRGWIESTLNAGRKACSILRNGGSIEEAKQLCTKDSLRQLLRTEKTLEVYLAPILHGPRYTSFGRHFTRVEILKKIVDRIQPYIENGDMVVDFCCGANDFSVLLNKKLTIGGKSCEFRNFDLHPPKDTFCFTQGDWFENDGHDFFEGNRLIIGLNPPFGYMASLADKFILHALKFKPKLLILIVPPETMRSVVFWVLFLYFSLFSLLQPYSSGEAHGQPLELFKLAFSRSFSRRYQDFNYELVWVDDALLSGKAFFIPGSVEDSTNGKENENQNMLQWNKVTPPLFLWSSRDMIIRHKEIALRCQHIKGPPVPPPPFPPP